MTAYEIITIFIGIKTMMISYGSLIVALLSFFNKERPLVNRVSKRRK